jgi:hypothetical protein
LLLIISCTPAKKEPIAVTGSVIPLSESYEDAIFDEDEDK